MENTNIILIGMPGCGKSTCGVLAAKAMCKSFIDSDLMIQGKEGMKLQDIIDKKGNDYFASLEENVLLDVIAYNCIIATGGSAIYSDKAMMHFKENGKIVYLKIDFDEMMGRIKNMTTRGILLKNGETIEQMFRHREALYEKYADVIIDCDSNTVEETVAEICKIK